VVPNSAPTAGPASQVLGTDGSVIGPGQTVPDVGGVRFEAVATDPDADAVRLQVEVRAVGSAFSDQATAESAPVSSGQTAGCTAYLPRGSYHWQFRVADSAGLTSDWASFGGGTSADFEVIWAGSSGGAACSSSAPFGAGATEDRGGSARTGTAICWAWILLLVAAAVRLDTYSLQPRRPVG
jgi:hypothetical protein